MYKKFVKNFEIFKYKGMYLNKKKFFIEPKNVDLDNLKNLKKTENDTINDESIE